MARAPDHRAERARDMFLTGKKLVDIANELGVPDSTVRRWKHTYKWEGERSEKKSERSEQISIPRALAGPDSNLPQFSSSHPYFFQQNVNFPSTVPSLLPLSPKQNPHFLPNPQCECPGDFMIASHSH